MNSVFATLGPDAGCSVPLPLVNLQQTPDGELVLHLTPSGRQHLDLIEALRDSAGLHEALRVLLGGHRQNGWDVIRPEEIGAWTAAPIVSDQVERTDCGQLERVGRVYWFADYLELDEIEELRTTGRLVFRGTN